MRRIGSTGMAAVVVAAFGIGIGASMATGSWVTESEKVPITFSEGEYAGQYNPADIRGSYSFGDIEDSFGVPIDVLARAFGFGDSPDPGSLAAKSLEETYGETTDGGEIGTDSLRLFVSLYSGLPYTPEETTRLLSPAQAELEEKLAPADLSALQDRLIPLGQLSAGGVTSEVAPAAAVATDAETHDDDETVVRGRTTFAELLDWGLTQQQIEEIIDMPMGARSETVRNVLTEAGKEFSSYRDALQELVAQSADAVQE